MCDTVGGGRGGISDNASHSLEFNPNFMVLLINYKGSRSGDEITYVDMYVYWELRPGKLAIIISACLSLYSQVNDDEEATEAVHSVFVYESARRH